MSAVWKILEGWLQDSDLIRTNRLFLRVLYSVTLLNFLYLIPIADIIWGTDHFIILRDPYSGAGKLAMLLNHESWRQYYLWFLAPMLLLLLAGVFGYTHFLARIIIWFLFVNLHFGNPEVSNGGWHVLHHALFFSIFMFSPEKNKIEQSTEIQRLCAHLSHHSIRILLAMVYSVAGIHKLLGTHWVFGDAMLIVLSIPEYSLPFLSETLRENNLLLELITWCTLAYQLAFPMFIWWHKYRKHLLISGLLFHLSIVFVVGVADFGLIMIAMYSIFIEIQEGNHYSVLPPFLRKKMAGINNISGRGD